ncbi:MAG TPA: VanZ family protein [Segetibacter sp.]
MKLGLYKFLPGIAWFITTVILLTLPANKFPEDNIFQIPQQDKIIHVIFFFLLVYLFARPLKSSGFNSFQKKSWFIRIAFYGLAYGIIIEFIQKYFVPNRDYDAWDILADGVGCLAAYLYSIRFFMATKKATKK